MTHAAARGVKLGNTAPEAGTVRAKPDPRAAPRADGDPSLRRGCANPEASSSAVRIPADVSGPSTPGRGAGFNPANRFGANHLEPFDVDVPCEDDVPRTLKTTFFADRSKSILTRNDSPDVPFTWSINPYRGCEHGCIYCYARPSHEYLGFSAGLDFESKIVVKPDAPELLRDALQSRKWEPQVVCISGNTDGYQPVERALGITRKCLEVFRDFRNPVAVITKNALVSRDTDILADLARFDAVNVTFSVTTLDTDVARSMEPRASAPMRRLAAMRTLADAGVPVAVNIGPVVPGLTDDEIPAILAAAKAHGATGAGFLMMRLPGLVEPLFVEWVQRVFPARAQRVLARIRDVRQGDLHDTRFGTRMRGEGAIADAVARLFEIHAARLGLGTRRFDLSAAHFIRPGGRQGELFHGGD